MEEGKFRGRGGEENEEGEEEIDNNQSTVILLKVRENIGIRMSSRIKSREGIRRTLFLEAFSV